MARTQATGINRVVVELFSSQITEILGVTMCRTWKDWLRTQQSTPGKDHRFKSGHPDKTDQQVRGGIPR